MSQITELYWYRQMDVITVQPALISLTVYALFPTHPSIRT